MFRFAPKYFTLTLIFFVAELLIGVYMTDAIIRPYGGDFLVVVLIYCFVKSFVRLPVKTVAVATLLFAYLVEIVQYFKLTVLLGLKHSKLANIILGNSFSWTDMLCYTLGILAVVTIEKFAEKMTLDEE